MKKVAIENSTLKFLKELSKNNDREWFNKHKTIYTSAQENIIAFIDELIVEMSKHDQLEIESGKKCLYRIYSDVRFSKDKSPYKPRFAFGLRRATKFKRGGYYLNMKPAHTYLACGFFNPSPEDLKRIRTDISINYEDWFRLLKSKSIKTFFGEMKGDAVLTVPRGFEKDHPAIKLIRHKQFILKHSFKDSEVTSPDFLKEVNKIFKAVRPFFDYVSEVLTTDLNGEVNV